MTHHPPPLAPTLYICMFSPYVVLNRFSTAVSGILPQNCAMRQWDKANHFRTVRLRIVFWILLWITGLKLWVIFCVTTIDFAWLSHDQREQNLERKLLVSLSLLDLSCLSCDPTAQLSSYAVICIIFMFAEVHLVLPFSWKCLYI